MRSSNVSSNAMYDAEEVELDLHSHISMRVYKIGEEHFSVYEYVK